MATYKEILPSNIKTARSFLSQLIDVLQEDISGSSSRRRYQVFVTGGVGPGVTSSLFQTIYDQDFTLQTANAVFDMTVGIFKNTTDSTSVYGKTFNGVDSAGKELFPSSSMMMREKLDIYRQFASALLGSSDAQFTVPYNSTQKVDVALFLAFKRLFARDQIKKESFAMKFFQSASVVLNAPNVVGENILARPDATLLPPSIYTDINASTNQQISFGGAVGNIVNAATYGALDVDRSAVGLLFYDRGIAVFDLAKITSASQYMTGTIDAMSISGKLTLGRAGTQSAYRSTFIPDFITSASIDNIVDHIAGTRFGYQSSTAITFQNITNINSTLIFCQASADEFNYSSNPTYVDAGNRIAVIDSGQELYQQSFTFITTVGLYDANNNLLAVAKLSRPVEKSSERDLTLRIRLDF